MNILKIQRENGRVIVIDEYGTRMNLKDDHNLKGSINNEPGLSYWEKKELLKSLGIE